MVAGEENGLASGGVSGPHVVEHVVAEVEDLRGVDAVVAEEGVEDDLKEAGGRFGDAMAIGPGAVVGVDSELLDGRSGVGGEQQRGVELGVGDDAEGKTGFVQGGEHGDEAGHGGDGVDPAFVFEGGDAEKVIAGEVVGGGELRMESKEFGPDFPDVDFGGVDAAGAGAGMIVVNAGPP